MCSELIGLFKKMSNAIETNLANKNIDNISTLFTDEEITIDLTQIVPEASSHITLGYYFTDERERIIAGKTISPSNNKQKQAQNWITISATEIPAGAVNLSFFID
ncbi:MAG: hypothetical protein Tsb0014_05060 [Pleurocapsa sp.]